MQNDQHEKRRESGCTRAAHDANTGTHDGPTQLTGGEAHLDREDENPARARAVERERGETDFHVLVVWEERSARVGVAANLSVQLGATPAWVMLDPIKSFARSATLRQKQSPSPSCGLDFLPKPSKAVCAAGSSSRVMSGGAGGGGLRPLHTIVAGVCLHGCTPQDRGQMLSPKFAVFLGSADARPCCRRRGRPTR